MKKGPTSIIPKLLWEALCIAFVTCIMLEQANAMPPNSHKKMALRVGKCIEPAKFGLKAYKVVERLQLQTAHRLDNGQDKNIEHCRI